MRNQNNTRQMLRGQVVVSRQPHDQARLSTRPAADATDRRYSPPATATALADVAPLLVGLLPFSVAIGSTASTVGLSLIETIAAALLTLAGASQLVALGLIGSGAGVFMTVIAAATLNVRFSFYGAGIGRWFADLPRWQQMLLVVPIVDQSFLLCEDRFKSEAEVGWRVRYYLIVTAGLLGVFCLGQVAGYLLGVSLPPSMGLHLAGPLVFAGMLAKSLESRPQRSAACAAALIVVALSSLPTGLPLAVAIVAGVAAALATPVQAPPSTYSVKLTAEPAQQGVST